MTRTPTFNTFGARLRAAREAAGYSRGELARRLHAAGTPAEVVTVYRWERGQRAPRRRHVEALADVLGVEPDWLLTGTGEPPAWVPHAPTLTVALWRFPRAEFADWLGLIGSPTGTDLVRSYEDYLVWLRAAAASAREHGCTVRIKRFSVAAMRAALARLGLANTPDGRAEVTARWPLPPG